MRERAVFVTCLFAALLSGLGLFSKNMADGATWLDGVFLVSGAVCLALGVIFLSRRLKRVGTELHEHREG